MDSELGRRANAPSLSSIQPWTRAIDMTTLSFRPYGIRPNVGAMNSNPTQSVDHMRTPEFARVDTWESVEGFASKQMHVVGLVRVSSLHDENLYAPCWNTSDSVAREYFPSRWLTTRSLSATRESGMP